MKKPKDFSVTYKCNLCGSTALNGYICSGWSANAALQDLPAMRSHKCDDGLVGVAFAFEIVEINAG